MLHVRILCCRSHWNNTPIRSDQECIRPSLSSFLAWDYVTLIMQLLHYTPSPTCKLGLTGSYVILVDPKNDLWREETLTLILATCIQSSSSSYLWFSSDWWLGRLRVIIIIVYMFTGVVSLQWLTRGLVLSLLLPPYSSSAVVLTIVPIISFFKTAWCYTGQYRRIGLLRACACWDNSGELCAW